MCLSFVGDIKNGKKSNYYLDYERVFSKMENKLILKNGWEGFGKED